MCGIVGYVGTKEAGPILLDGLKALEYRGYDSAGLQINGAGRLRAVGPVANLAAAFMATPLAGHVGIAHTRWATHGSPKSENTHPHADCRGEIFVVHNGIIENYLELKEGLISRGHIFVSETDTEVLAHLFEETFAVSHDPLAAVKAGLNRVRGTYGIVVSFAQAPENLIAARMGSPIVLGLGEGEYFIASDPSALVTHTKSIVYLEDGDIARLDVSGYAVESLRTGAPAEREPQTIEWDVAEAQKGGYDHFMLKEIMEGPDVIENTMRGRCMPGTGDVKLGGLEGVKGQLSQIERIIIVGCGTAYYAGLVGEYMLEAHAGIPVEVELGSEFRYRKPVLNQRTAVLAISQSGETADTLEAIREGKRKGALTLGIVNTVGSTIARETDAGIYNHAGPEIGVASTKALISQLTALVLLTVFLGRQRGMTEAEGQAIVAELSTLPDKVRLILERHEEVEVVATKYAGMRDFLYIGRTYLYPIALEGALKLKEISYIHAEGCGAGEMKHGPIAMIDANFPTIALSPLGSVYEKMRSNIEEIKARGGPVIAVATEGDAGIAQLADDVLYIPETIEMLTPILAVVPLQLFAYYVAKGKGLNVDRPRNLAKSVTVE